MPTIDEPAGIGQGGGRSAEPDIPLTSEEIDKLLTAVSTAFPTNAGARRLLRRIDYPVDRIPTFTGHHTDAWNDVFFAFENGVIGAPYRRVLAAALRDYPAHPVLVSLAQRHGIAPGGSNRDSSLVHPPDRSSGTASLGQVAAQLTDRRGAAEFDVALSFAGQDRAHAHRLADLLRAQGHTVFYDEYEKSSLWGKDLYQHLTDVYQHKAHYCVIFLSVHYGNRLWTKHELKSAQARAFTEGREYILPLRLDDTEIPGVLATTGYLDLRSTDLEEVAALLQRKLQKNHPVDPDQA